MNNCFQTEASIAEKDFKLKDLELKTIFLTFSHTSYIAHQYGPILVFIKSERHIWIIYCIHFNYIY